MDESVVEVSKFKEALEFLDCVWFWPVLDGVHFPLVHLDAIFDDEVSEEQM